MKAIFVFYYIEYDEALMGILEKVGVRAYSKWEKILGKGKGSAPRLDTAVWPGFNGALLIGVDEQQAEALLKELKAFTERHKGKGISAFVLPLEKVI